MRAASLQVELVPSFAAAEPLRPCWDQWAADNVLLQWPWLAAWWRAYGGRPGRSCAILRFVAAHQATVGILPLYFQYRYGCRELRYMGDGEACSDYIRILCEPGSEPAIAEALADWLQARERSAATPSPDWLELEGHRSQEPGWEAVGTALARRGWTRRQQTICGSWLVALPNDWQAYTLSLSKSRRRKISKALKLQRLGEIQFEIGSTPEQIAAWWPEFVELHQRRRQTLGEPGCFASPEFARFLPEAVAELAGLGRAHLVRLSAESQPLGCLLWLESAAGVAVYQSGFEPHARSLEPGHLLNALGLDWAFRRGVRAYDFLRGDEHYKSGWGGLRCELQATRYVAPRWAAQGKDWLWQTARDWKARWHPPRGKEEATEPTESDGEPQESAGTSPPPAMAPVGHAD